MLISYRGTQELTGLSRSTIERLVDKDAFPRPVRITAGRLGFVRDEIEAWARDRVRARDEGRRPEDDLVMRATAPQLPDWHINAANSRAARVPARSAVRLSSPLPASNPEAART
jgi:predicted DNA-binding transcriptional regulator AlpA